MHKAIKECLGYEEKDDEKEILKLWKQRTRDICKPCWELKYCPYGPIVEDFPLLPGTRKAAIDHNTYFQKCLETGKTSGGSDLTDFQKNFFEKSVSSFNEDDFPEMIPKDIKLASCRVFGHMCPVFYVAEPLTEIKHGRKHSRSIPGDVMLQVVRRDGQICQICHQPVMDTEIEFDYIIPFSRGGTSTTDNLRVVHSSCITSKSNTL